MRDDWVCKKWRGVLAAVVDGTASFEERRALQEHLARCARCRQEYGALTEVRRVVRLLERQHAPRKLADNVQYALQGQRSTVKPFEWLGNVAGGWLVRGMSLAAAAVVVLVAAHLVSERSTTKELAGDETPRLAELRDHAMDAELVHHARDLQLAAPDRFFVDRAVTDLTYAVSWQDLAPPPHPGPSTSPTGRGIQ